MLSTYCCDRLITSVGFSQYPYRLLFGEPAFLHENRLLYLGQFSTYDWYSPRAACPHHCPYSVDRSYGVTFYTLREC